MNAPKTLDLAAIRALINEHLPDNKEGLITPADLRFALMLILVVIEEGIDR